MENGTFIVAIGLTVFAGLATGIGSALAFFTKTTNKKFLALSLGFSAGVMIYVSLVEIFVKSKDALTDKFGEVNGNWLTVASFFGGIALIAIIDKLIPSFENPHEMRMVEDIGKVQPPKNKLYRMGIFTALAIAIHNFPEGLATFTAALSDPSLGIAIAIAIAIHNIPEGIAVSVPIFYATNNKKKAFTYSFLSGLAEPVGAIVGYLILLPFIEHSQTVMGIVFGMVAGIMVFISLDELLPASREYGEHHLSVYGLVAGMAVMSVSLLLFM
ncbi:MAG: zinc transporter ZupT [Bacteroidales bacterium]|jgi:ZIP family zinc transporter|nr:zinc transporter ZupT [Bacteroidales bacterium]